MLDQTAMLGSAVGSGGIPIAWADPTATPQTRGHRGEQGNLLQPFRGCRVPLARPGHGGGPSPGGGRGAGPGEARGARGARPGPARPSAVLCPPLVAAPGRWLCGTRCGLPQSPGAPATLRGWYCAGCAAGCPSPRILPLCGCAGPAAGCPRAPGRLRGSCRP